jgi:hypothetical protein
MSIIEEVCSVRGHNLQSLITSQIVDPVTKVAVNRHEIRCAQCGKTLEECLKFRIGGTGAKRRKKAKLESSSGHAIASKESKNSGLEPVPSPAGDVPNLQSAS